MERYWAAVAKSERKMILKISITRSRVAGGGLSGLEDHAKKGFDFHSKYCKKPLELP